MWEYCELDAYKIYSHDISSLSQCYESEDSTPISEVSIIKDLLIMSKRGL